MVEYLIVVAIVGIAAIGAWQAFGGTVEAETEANALTIRTMSGTSGDASFTVVGAPVAASAAEHDAGASGGGGGFFSGLGRGVWDGGVDTVTGLASLAAGVLSGTAYAVTHPVATGRAIADAVAHPGATLASAWETTKVIGSGVASGASDALRTLVHGTARERGELVGRGLFEAASFAVPVSKVSKVAHAAKLARAAETGAVTSRGLASAVATVRHPFRRLREWHGGRWRGYNRAARLEAQDVSYGHAANEAEAFARTRGWEPTAAGRRQAYVPDEEVWVNAVAHRGWTDVDIHGSATGFGTTSPRALAQRLRENGYQDGPVRLLSCSTGACLRTGKNAAQQVADELGAPVVAPTSLLWAENRGWRMIVGERATRFRGPAGTRAGELFPEGEWRVFFPERGAAP
jgi:hypothetical protein